MSRTQLTIGIVCVILIGVIGMFTKLVSIGEGIIIILLMLVATPFLFDLMSKTARHDDDIKKHMH